MRGRSGIHVLAIALLIGFPAYAASADDPVAPFLGRWDLTLTAPDRTYASWLNVARQDSRLTVHMVGRWGHMRELPSAEIRNGRIRFVSPKEEEGYTDSDMVFEGEIAGQSLVGTTSGPDGATWTWRGEKAPLLKRQRAPQWGAPIQLFNGKDLAGWHPSDARVPVSWRVKDGVLVSSERGVDLTTDATFGDFRLHIEFKTLPGANSGVYLRGRYEVQIEDDAEPEGPSQRLGAVYGFIAPSPPPPRGSRGWQTYDITLIGRTVTVVLNGKTIIDGQEIPGITGGALDSHEAQPGPIYLQGSEAGQVAFRNIVLTPARESGCESLRSLDLAGGSISDASSQPAPRGVPSGEFCRVQAVLTPTSDSRIGIELWMPPPERWNGKFQGVGNGGLGGTIPRAALAAGLARGYATAATDTGHDNADGPGAFALGHPEKIVDYGHRAVHVMTLSGQSIASAYYGKPAQRSYFIGCSQGGQEAMMEAQRYPGDYDGIVAGDPDYIQTHHEVGAHLWVVSTLFANPESRITQADAQLIGDAVNAACDALDGVKDGVLEDPRRCNFDPGALQCQGADRSHCLSEAQVQAVRKLWAGPDASIQRGYYPGLARGAEATLWQNWIVSDSAERNLHGALGLPFFKYFVYGAPNWDFRTFDYAKDALPIDARFGSALNAVDADLRPFQKRGGKLIHYHGFSDPDIPPAASIEYYASVAQQLRQTGVDVDSFYRLFMVPGMGHCSGGPGPDSFDALAALERWVEQGVSPESLLATKYVGQGSQRSASRTRPLCPYPKIARYSGKGSTDDARNFSCRDASQPPGD